MQNLSLLNVLSESPKLISMTGFRHGTTPLLQTTNDGLLQDLAVAVHGLFAAVTATYRGIVEIKSRCASSPHQAYGRKTKSCIRIYGDARDGTTRTIYLPLRAD